MNKPIKPMPPELPAKIDDWTRYIKTERTLNDLVEDLHRPLVEESEEYRAFLRAVYDEQAVEGSLSADNLEAARMLRERANTLGTEVAKEKLATIGKALNVVMKRYHASRKERRNMVEGQIVPTEDKGGD